MAAMVNYAENSFSQIPNKEILYCRNVPVYKLCLFVDRKFNMATSTRQSFNRGPYEKIRKEKILTN